jgi:propanol-preferring alcohol dehydrogenase
MENPMKAMVLRAFNTPLELADVPVPKPGPRDALVRVFACGSGLTLHHAVTGNNPVSLPMIVGHEVAGEVVETGKDAEGIKVGDLVTPHMYLFCGHCRFCLTNREPLCEAGPAVIGRQRDGGYAEFMAAPDRNWIKLPPGLLERYGATGACVIGDAITTPYKVVRRARLAPTETCVIYGAGGGVGIHLIQVARMRGARVIGIDRGADKLAAVSNEGAHEVIDAQKQDAAAEILRLTGGKGADVIADFVGITETLKNGLAALARGGRLVIVGLSRVSESELPTPAAQLLRMEQEILGSRAFTRQEIVDCLELAARGLLKPIVNHVYPLDKANDAHALVGAGRNIGRVVLSVAQP